MGKYLEPRHWLGFAKTLGVGQSDKIVHVGCGTRPSLHVQNDADRYWAYCHRCRKSGNQDKVGNVRIKQKVAEKTGWIPKQRKKLGDVLLNDPHMFREFIARNGWVAGNLSLLMFDEETKRVYLPDCAGNFLGLDSTGAAQARWYSPVKHYWSCVRVDDSTTAVVTDNPATYLKAVRDNMCAFYVVRPDAQLVARIVKYNDNGFRSIRLDHGVFKRHSSLTKELISVCDRVIIDTSLGNGG